VIPTLLILGLLTQRLWAIPVGALVWTILLLALGTAGLSQLPLTAGLAAANLAVGVVVHRMLRHIWRRRPALPGLTRG
jgi:hypothetical protein